MAKDGLDDNVNLLDYLIVVLKHKRLILSITLSIAVIVGIISFLLSPYYRAEVRLMPQQQQRGSSLAMQMMSQIAGSSVTGLTAGALGLQSPADLYVGMLRSRTILDRIIKKFGLMEVYGVETMDEARKTLGDSISASAGVDGIIVLKVEDEDPRRAADMANAFVDELKALNTDLMVDAVAQKRAFYERQLEDVRKSLFSSEESLKKFQEKTSVLEMDEQAKAAIEGIASLKAAIAAKEVELKVIGAYATKENPNYQRVATEIQGLKSELAKMTEKKSDKGDPIIATGAAPSIGVEYMRRMRDLKSNEILFEVLMRQYQLSRMEEDMNGSIVQVIDGAVPPEKRAGPKRILNIIAGLISGFLISLIVAFVLEYRSRVAKNPENRQRLEELNALLGRDSGS